MRVRNTHVWGALALALLESIFRADTCLSFIAVHHSQLKKHFLR
jgi:hypothetical protein